MEGGIASGDPGSNTGIFEEKTVRKALDTRLFVKGIDIDWNRVEVSSYLRSISAIKGVEHLDFHCPVTFFVGENGSGKSTLLEAIAIAAGFNPEGGTRNYCFSTYDSHSGLWEALRLTRGIKREKWGYFLRAESFYNVASAEEEYSRQAGGVPMHFHERSHGEGFLTLMQNTFTEHGLFILDEPEAALSPQRQLTLLAEITNCVNRDSQFVIATHSPILLGMPEAEILSFDGEGIHKCSYEDTESYQVMEMFINNRKELLRRLL